MNARMSGSSRFRSCGFLLLVLSLVGACAKVIGADFDDLKPRDLAGSGGSGEGGSAGDNGSGQGGADQGGMAGSETGGGGASGEMGGAAADAGAFDADDANAHDASTDRSEDATDARGADAHDAGADVANDVAFDGPEDASADARSDAPTGTFVINELQGIGDDWIELYNPGDAPFVLDGYAVAQASGSNGPPDLATILVFPAGTTLNAGSYLMVLCKQATAGGPVGGCAGLATSCFTVTWGISSSSGEGMYLLRPDRSVFSLVNYPPPSLDGGAPMSGETWGRVPNGTGPFTVTVPTPDAPNHP